VTDADFAAAHDEAYGSFAADFAAAHDEAYGSFADAQRRAAHAPAELLALPLTADAMIERAPRRPLPPFLMDGLLVAFALVAVLAFLAGLVIGRAL
jgi:hypothetical protein